MIHRLKVAFVGSLLSVGIALFVTWGHDIYNFHRYCPMAPLCTAYTMPEHGIVYIFGFTLFITLMAAALFTRRLFCSTLCPFGFIQDILAIPMLKKKLKKRFITTETTRKLSFTSRAVVLLGTLFLPLIIGSMAFEYLCPITLFGDVYYGIGAVSAGVTLLLFVVFSAIIPRFFCRFVCPLGLQLGASGKIGAKFFPSYTTHISCPLTSFACKACSATCPTGIDVGKLHGDIDDIDCIQCMACVQVCPVKKKKKSKK